MANVMIHVWGTEANGVHNNGSSPTISDMVLTASGLWTCGVANDSSSSTLTHATITTSMDYEDSHGICNQADGGSYTVRVNNSQITSLGNTIINDAEFTTRVGASQLAGGAVITGGGTVTCAGVYDENYVFRASTCP